MSDAGITKILLFVACTIIVLNTTNFRAVSSRPVVSTICGIKYLTVLNYLAIILCNPRFYGQQVIIYLKYYLTSSVPFMTAVCPG